MPLVTSVLVSSVAAFDLLVGMMSKLPKLPDTYTSSDLTAMSATNPFMRMVGKRVMNPPVDILAIAADRLASAKAAYDATRHMQHSHESSVASNLAWTEFTQVMHDYHAAEDLSEALVRG